MRYTLDIARLITETPGIQDIINFAELKHHLGAMVERLKEIELADKKLQHELSTPFIGIGGGTTDIYTGDLTVEQIKEEVLEYLHEREITDPEALEAHLMETGQSGRINYEIIDLSDSSQWVLQPSNSAQWVHIHPAKRGPHMARFKNVILKTTLLSYAVALTRGTKPSSPKTINYVRKNLGLPDLDAPTKNMNIFTKLINRAYHKS